MPRTLRLLILFAALWFIGDRAGAFALARLLDHSREPIAQLYGGRAAAEVVVLGNSRAYRNLDLDSLAARFGGRVTSLAQPGMSMELSRALFDDYVDRHGAPRVLIVELSALFSDASSLKDLRTYASRSRRIEHLVQKHFSTLHYAGMVSALFNYNSHFVLNAMHKVFYAMPDQRLDGSWNERDQAVQPGRYFVPLDDNITAAEKLMDTVRRCGIDVRLMLTPVAPAYAAANRIDELRSAIDRIAGGKRVWDLADTPPTDLRFFVDPSHLNRDGVRSFMAELTSQGFFAASNGRTGSKASCVTAD